MKLPDCIRTEKNVPFIKGRWMAYCYPELPNDIHGAGDCEKTAISDLLDKIDDVKLEKLVTEIVNGNLNAVPAWANEIDLSQKIDTEIMKKLVMDMISRDQPDSSSVRATDDCSPCCDSFDENAPVDEFPEF